MMYFNNFMIRSVLMGLLVSLISACGGGSSGGGNVSNGGSTPPSPSQITSKNVIPVTVDLGPSGNAVNQLFGSVTLCQPGSTTQCQTIDHVLVDTGSTGLRVFSAAIPATMNLGRLTGPGGLPLLNCAQFIDNTYAWGPVAAADVVLGGETATSVPIQIIADPAYNIPNRLCSSRGRATEITAAATYGANGILGLGLFKEDCGAGCVTNAANGFYFTCTDATCTASVATTASTAQQVKHPVPLFSADNNGVLIDLPAVSSAGAAKLSGSLIFGIGTQSNNQFTSGSVLTTDSSGNITTQFGGRSLSTSFIDSGSNGLYFDSATVPTCATGSIADGFYCPSSLSSLSATLVGANAKTAVVTFLIGNALSLFADPSLAVLPTLSGPMGDAQTFDWGLPFYYGRRVFLGIEGQVSAQGTGPFYAF
jgi:hypothetical protein